MIYRENIKISTQNSLSVSHFRVQKNDCQKEDDVIYISSLCIV